MSSQFDGLAQMYEDMFALPWRKDLESHSVLAALGRVRGERVLDIGCGTGLYSRLLKAQGADLVMGQDVSEGMLSYARAQEPADRRGIEYVRTLPSALEGTFDAALGVYVLPYAEQYAELVELCGLAARALKPGGRFVTLPVNPDYDGGREYYRRYGLRLFDAEPRFDASKVTLELEFGPYQETITARYWSRRALERALTEVGFTDIGWPPFRVSDQGMREHGASFWEPYLRSPHASLITCVKGPSTPGTAARDTSVPRPSTP
ncbi:Ubiquinone/menaquinone biosynthesis C-methylase UbiE [Streptomyces sp. TLI_053]|uniref:class I SAM-dependent methyltransferase n=1 Tax=Streptomyces sp. TLI_053 TaxID=1855352 RepID=UPI00087A74FC|nr:class I SAM-dependent methyltransferase [Streptomyces sp. TLI_053]SDT83163.1 Ubiquinone/menaquinone biosynthesis C-methylase UbiE [Streptomyces sp. TLI_053]